MDLDIKEFTFLTKDQIFGDNRIDLFKKIDAKCILTDYAIALGYEFDKGVAEDFLLKEIPGNYCLSSFEHPKLPDVVLNDGTQSYIFFDLGYFGCRPIFSLSDISSLVPDDLPKNDNDLIEIEYGEFPQVAAPISIERELESAKWSFHNPLVKTGKKYHFEYTTGGSSKIVENEEYAYKGKKYVQVKIQTAGVYTFSNGKKYRAGENIWIEVTPLKWYIDVNSKLVISKNLIFSGVRCCDTKGHKCNNFKKTEAYDYLNNYFSQDIIPKEIPEPVLENSANIEVEDQDDAVDEIEDETDPESSYDEQNLVDDYEDEEPEIEEEPQNAIIEDTDNPYDLDMQKVSEEDIIRGAIESGVAVFLHGPSSEGKSARVKQIDPNCVIIYLRNATPDSLNGKSVYNSETGEMIDVKPTWLKKLEELCESEPDKLHIVFFDEITNALPSIQGIAFNIVLDREVNGLWKLPENARIVAAGNEMKDSLSANQLAEPLFNRFAHVYIKTTTEDWLKWAAEHNIHPAIYSYIAYRNGLPLRSQYNGETPNADPRKWEMASKMLYTTGKPEMLRSLVGEDITSEFVEFCNQSVLTLEDVINDNYEYNYIKFLNTSSKYATIIGLTQVSSKNLKKVRNFVMDLGPEFVAIFDSLWAHGDAQKLELIAELRTLDNARLSRSRIF